MMRRSCLSNLFSEVYNGTPSHTAALFVSQNFAFGLTLGTPKAMVGFHDAPLEARGGLGFRV